jgi:plasmid stabilization system protein ParE
MARLTWLPESRHDLERLLAFLKTKSPLAAVRAVEAIVAAASSLENYPEVGPPIGDGTGRREFVIPFGSGAYVLRYRVEGNDVVILRVWHGRENRD